MKSTHDKKYIGCPKKAKTNALRRKEQDKKRWYPKFHIGHFPIGTVVEVESPRAGNIISDEADRINPDEVYPRQQVTVSGILNNGPDSWLIKLTKQCELGTWLNSINIGWVRSIVSRGPGYLTTEDQAEVDRINAEHNAKKARILGHRPTNHGSEWPMTKGNCYAAYSFSMLTHHLVYNHPTLKIKDHTHLVDVDALAHALYLRFKHTLDIEERMFYVPRKKLYRAYKQLLAKYFVRRRVESAIDARMNMEQYERDMEAEYANDPWFN